MMTMRAKSLATVASALASFLVIPSGVEASCNTIPSMRAIRSATTGFPSVQVPTDLPFRGEIGRIDRVVVVPGVTPEVVVGSDPECDGTASEAVEKNTIGLIFRQTVAGKSAQVVSYATAKPTPAAAAVLDSLTSRLHVPEYRVSEHALELRKGVDASERFAVPLDDHDGPGRLSVVVLESSVLDGDESLAWLNGSSEISPCQALAARLAAPLANRAQTIHACVDRIYDDYIPGQPCGTKDANVDALAVAAFMTDNENNFRKECDGLGDGATSDLVTCGADAEELVISVHPDNGMLEIPFNYTSIRKYKPEQHHPDPADRELSGVSALSRGPGVMQGDLARVFVPGREFLGSIAPGDKPGNPRRPDIDVQAPLAGSHELHVKGSVDQDRSIVRFYPRVPVALVCGENPEQACQTFARSGDDETPICACEEAGKKDGCSDLCRKLDDPRYYECEGGYFDGLPCTRPNHCGEGSTCSAQPQCTPRFATWRTYGVLPQNKCWSDADCTTAGFPQCGYQLFNFASRVPGSGDNYYPAQYEIGSTTPDQVGVCQGDRNVACSNAVACPADIDPCLGYSLRAHGKKYGD